MCNSIYVYIYIHTCFPIEHNILLLDTNCVIYYYLLLFIKIYTKFNKYCALYKILTIHFANQIFIRHKPNKLLCTKPIGKESFIYIVHRMHIHHKKTFPHKNIHI